MTGKKGSKSACSPEDPGCCCNIEAVVSIDERGQMVLPKEFRTKAGIKTGDKLGLVSIEKSGEVGCFLLFKIDALASAVKVIIEPLMKEAIDK